MPTKVIAAAPADEPGAAWLTHTNPLAPVAARHCAGHIHDLADLLGGIACEDAWAKALTADLLVALEFDLPLILEADPTYIDEVAVARAMRGEDLELTELERAEVRRRLAEVRTHRNRVRFTCSRAAAARREAAR
ncbi:hypothetical protein Cme02nite_20760 [Catellatospora methionotrophica]|uniref:Uncharacterized protein n=1 Tax=Catellatospora methionotrophica TaxID=121620 RepID=A0A8J3PEJ2_9ACTN|nr:hypothetical protein [Catellatospora methionotrophica]GIG13744.1 hypothetical protein Cme02nite_20760 [Catellatospora methionotrophica]